MNWISQAPQSTSLDLLNMTMNVEVSYYPDETWAFKLFNNFCRQVFRVMRRPCSLHLVIDERLAFFISETKYEQYKTQSVGWFMPL